MQFEVTTFINNFFIKIIIFKTIKLHFEKYVSFELLFI